MVRYLKIGNEESQNQDSRIIGFSGLEEEVRIKILNPVNLSIL